MSTDTNSTSPSIPRSHVSDDSDTIAAANKSHWDTHAKASDENPIYVELGRKVVEGIINTYPTLFDPAHTTVLDFACGTGLISRQLLTHAQTITGVDISQGMVDQYNSRAHELRIQPERMHAIRTDVLSEDTVLNGQTFDLIVCASAYHHIPDIDSITRKLSTYLKPGGSLLVVDWLKKEAPYIQGEALQSYGHIIPHVSGFDASEMELIFRNAKLVNFQFNELMTYEMHGIKAQFFLAKGQCTN